MREIPLTRGLVALVDDGDFEWLSQWKWHADKDNYVKRNVTTSKKPYRQTRVLMHREILGLEYGDPREGDHINLNRLDNRRSNLRVCTRRQNEYNKGPRIDNTSGYKGVSFYKRTRKWMARILDNGKRRYLGSYETPQEAYEAYKCAAKIIHGDFFNAGELIDFSGDHHD